MPPTQVTESMFQLTWESDVDTLTIRLIDTLAAGAAIAYLGGLRGTAGCNCENYLSYGRIHVANDNLMACANSSSIHAHAIGTSQRYSANRFTYSNHTNVICVA